MTDDERDKAAADRADASAEPQQAAPITPLGPLPSGSWQPLGPAPIGPPFLQSGDFYAGPNAGRVDSIATLPSGAHAGRVVIGTAGGGVWTSDDNGATWTPRSDQAPSLAVGAVADDPSSPDHLIAGTGEANQCGDCYPGLGILSSTNGGTTWTVQNPGGVFTGVSVAQVAIDPTNSNHMFAATNVGLFITSNGGTTWAEPATPTYLANVDGIVTAVVLNPTSPSTVYVGGVSKAVAKSTDGGTTWAAANTGIAVPSPATAPFIALGLAASAPAVLYASVGSTGPGTLYKTTNGGATWTPTAAPDFTGQAYSYGSGTASQGWYDNTVAVDPTNPNRVVAGGIGIVETIDGGATWANVNGKPFFVPPTTNKIHPDFHGLAFRPDGRVWLGCDGGMYLYDRTAPPATNIANKNGNLNTIQFYAGFNEVGGSVLAGSQDNGSSRTASPTLSPWTGIFTGDGGPSAITPNSPSTQFIEANTNLFVTTDAFSSVNRNITPPSPNPLFTPPMIIVPNTVTPTQPTVFYGGQNLWRTSNPTTVSPTWTKVTTGGGFVTAIAVAPSDPNVVYVGFKNGKIQVSTDGGNTFTSLATQPFGVTFVTGISVDPTNAKAITASVSFNNTRYALSAPHVGQYSYSGAPGAGTWTVVTGNLPALAGVSRVVYDNGALVAATDAGVYGTGTVSGGTTSWSLVGTGLPAVQVQDLFVDAGVLYAVTHGRGSWKLAGGPPPPPIPCTTTTTGNVAGPVVVPSGVHRCFVSATVTGGITVNPGGQLSATNSRIQGAIVSNGGRALDLCSNTIGPPSSGPALSVSNTTGPIRIGDPGSGCNGNNIVGSVSLTNNLDGLLFGSNYVQGNATVDNNSGGPILLQYNWFTGTLGCVGNTPPPTNNGNANTRGSVSGPDQCSAL